MKVGVDAQRCVGHAQCFAFAPQVYDLDDNGNCLVHDAEVPPELEDEARNGAAACPEQAITIVEADEAGST